MPTRQSTLHTSAPARSKSGQRGTATDALELLHTDHQQVEDLFAQFEKARTADRKEKLASQICSELKVHTQVEEELFYPAAREALRNGDLLDEATVEHGSAKALIEQIEASGPQESLFDATVMVLSEYIKHHVNEEENELFPQLRETDLDLVALGEALSERKNVLMQKIAR
jgi:hemerythrin superfamily protein